MFSIFTMLCCFIIFDIWVIILGILFVDSWALVEGCSSRPGLCLLLPRALPNQSHSKVDLQMASFIDHLSNMHVSHRPVGGLTCGYSSSGENVFFFHQLPGFKSGCFPCSPQEWKCCFYFFFILWAWSWRSQVFTGLLNQDDHELWQSKNGEGGRPSL